MADPSLRPCGLMEYFWTNECENRCCFLAIRSQPGWRLLFVIFCCLSNPTFLVCYYIPVGNICSVFLQGVTKPLRYSKHTGNNAAITYAVQQHIHRDKMAFDLWSECFVFCGLFFFFCCYYTIMLTLFRGGTLVVKICIDMTALTELVWWMRRKRISSAAMRSLTCLEDKELLFFFFLSFSFCRIRMSRRS